MSEPIMIESNAVTVREESQLPQRASLFGGNPQDVIKSASEAASALKDVVVKQGLISNISGKDYPRCEAWTLLGSMVGVFPVLCWTKPIQDGWEARVEARTISGAVVGAAEAQCLRTERNWDKREDFAVRSMAQTRATAKALRMPLGFVMTLAGYEPTPLEEMDYQRPPQSSPPPIKTPPTASERPKQAPPANPDPDAMAAVCKSRFLKVAKEKNWGIYIWKVACDLGWIMPNEKLEDADPHKFPKTAGAFNVIESAIKAEQEKAANSDGLPQELCEAYDKIYAPVGEKEDDVPMDDRPQDAPDAPWRSFPMPFGKHAGVQLAKLDKKYLYGLWCNYTVETEYNGKPKRPETIAKDKVLRQMLNEAGSHMQFTKKD